jgi:predicted phosphodiesterase
MKIAVLSDIHGNVPALEAVLDDMAQWRPDEVIVNGDLVSRGPYSLESLGLIQTHYPHARFLKGNHEELVLSCADDPRDPADPMFDLYRFAQWTATRLRDTLDEIRDWPESIDLTDLEGGLLHITHGSRLGNRAGIHPETTDDELSLKLGEPRDLFIASHTHRPLVRCYNGTLVVNVGSVGQPLDGDPRAAYGRFSFRNGRWEAKIVRVKYAKERAERDLYESGFLAEGGPPAQLIQLEVRQSRTHMGPWMARYLQAVKSCEMTVAEAVEHYLAAL